MFEVSRRDLVLSAAGAYAAFGLDKAVAFIGAAHAQQDGAPFRRHKIGDLEVISLLDGAVGVPPREGFIKNATVEDTKTALRAAGLSDERIPIPFTATVLKLGERVILVDSGAGGFPTYGPRSGSLLQSMSAAGIDPALIKTILISHLHGDHIYGLMNKDTNAPVFPNAEIIVPAGELRYWSRPELDAVDLGPTRKGLPQRIRETLAIWKNVRPFEGNGELVPGIRSLPAYGHSPGQVAHLVSAGTSGLLLTADVSLLPALFARNPHFEVSLDQDSQMAVETRKRIFDRAIADQLYVTGTHWLLPNVGTLSRDGSGYAFVPATA